LRLKQTFLFQKNWDRNTAKGSGSQDYANKSLLRKLRTPFSIRYSRLV